MAPRATLGQDADAPPIRLPAAVAVSDAGLLRSVSAVRALRDESVIVNDITGRRVLLLDAQLRLVRVLADADGLGGGSYGSRAAGLIRWRGDSTLFVDPASLSLSVLDPQGAVARVFAMPRPQDATFLIGGPFGAPGSDTAGRLIYRGAFRPTLPAGTPQSGIIDIVQPDSLPIFRVTSATRRVDTLAFVRIPQTTARIVVDDRGIRINTVVNPLSTVDDWTVDSVGTLTIVRGADLHLERRSPDGSIMRGPRPSFPWERIDDAARRHIVDSLARLVAANREAQAVAAPSAGGQGAGGSALAIVKPDELPDYRPAFRQGAAVLDRVGHLWLRTTLPSPSGPIYLVYDTEGRLAGRVHLPFGRIVVGFGTAYVYLAVAEGDGARLEAVPYSPGALLRLE